MYGNFGNNRGFGGGRNNQQDYNRSPPVNEGEEFDVRIEAVGEKGDGVAKKDGFVLFVPNVKENDEVRIKVTKVLRKVGFAEVLGPAQGPIAEASAPAPKARSAAEEKAAEIRQVEQNAQNMEDSEDFGDEPEEEASEETTEDVAEEPAMDEEVAQESADEPAEEEVPVADEPADEVVEDEAPADDMSAPEEEPAEEVTEDVAEEPVEDSEEDEEPKQQ